MPNAALYGCVYDGETVESAKAQIDRLFANAAKKGFDVASLHFDVLYSNPEQKQAAAQALTTHVTGLHPDVPVHIS